MKPLKIKQEAKIIQLFSNLLTSGFHLGESIDFLDKSHLVSSHYTKKMQEGLVSGESFSLILKGLGFSDMITTQIALAEGYGQLEVTLGHIYSYLMSLQKVKRKLAEVATYPLVLLGFLIIIMVGLKQYLLPQMEGENLATAIVTQLPSVLLGGAFGIFLLTIGVIWYMKRSRKIPLMTKLSRLPIIGKLTRSYLSAYYAREWGSMISQGLEMTRIVTLMQEQDNPLFAEIGQDLEKAMARGVLFHDQVATYAFFNPELSLMIAYGQFKDKLGRELAIYADEAWEGFFFQVNRKMQWVQPVVFLLVAIIIVLIYVAMLLPMYQSMEV